MQAAIMMTLPSMLEERELSGSEEVVGWFEGRKEDSHGPYRVVDRRICHAVNNLDFITATSGLTGIILDVGKGSNVG